MVLLGEDPPREVEITLPGDGVALIPVRSVGRDDSSATSLVVKESVEDTDVTDGMEITARVAFREDGDTTIDGGAGIGRVTKAGLQLKVGAAAINPVPRKMIRDAVSALDPRAMNVVISAPKGEEIAEKTYNSRIGIVDGISIIGTTGIMKAKSSESFKDTISTQLHFLKKNNAKEIIITPGNISEEAMCLKFKDRVSKETIVQSGDFLGFTLKETVKTGIPFILAGHPGKLGKVLNGDFQTHYSKSGPANEAVIELLQAHVGDEILKALKESPTVEGIVTTMIKEDKKELLDMLADNIETCVKEYLKITSSVPTLLFNMDKVLIGTSKAGKRWTER